MQMRRSVGGLLAIAAAVLLTGSLPSAAGAAPRSPATPGQAELKVKGWVHWTQYIPAKQQGDVGEVSGGETRTGKFFIDVYSADGLTWNSFALSSYDVTDDLDITATNDGCTTKETGHVADSGHLPYFSADGVYPYNFVDWSDTDPHLVTFIIAVEEDETVTYSYSGNGCSGSTTDTIPVDFAPTCSKIQLGGDGIAGAFDGHTDTAKTDCHGTTTKGDPKGIKYSIGGKLDVDAYLFVLPRDALSPAKWKEELTKQHHDYPAADIRVPDGTPFYAITAGHVVYLDNKTCGTGITLYGLDGVHYTYCHASERDAANGAKVLPGWELGLTGQSGDADGPHLHFEIRTQPFTKMDTRCPQSLLWALYEASQPPPDASTVYDLPTTGCYYKKKK
jgi:hypothetical protein